MSDDKTPDLSPSKKMTRACTCHPVEAPRPCQQKYAYNDCLHAAKDAEIERLRSPRFKVAVLQPDEDSPGLTSSDGEGEVMEIHYARW